VLTRSQIAARLRDERGVSLVVALGILLVLSLTTVGTIEYTSAGARHSNLSRANTLAQTLAEAGLNDAQARLADPANNALTGSLLTPSSGGVTCPDGVSTCFQSSYEGGSTRWYGTLDTATNKWTIHSWGLTKNPTDPSKDFQRYIKATTTIFADPSQPYNGTAWNYVLMTKTSNSTTCDVLVDNDAIVDTNFYVAGNLCLDNNAKVLEPDHTKPLTLTVHGKLRIANGTTSVGNSTTDTVAYARIGQGCTGNIASAGHTCTTADRFWVDDYTTAPETITPPTPDWTGYYAAAKPGPAAGNGCTTSTGTVPVWDNDSTLDLATNGSAGTFNLTPVSDYSCKHISSGVTVGELSWVASTRTLTVKGAMYFDGSMTFSGTNYYNGSGTIYLTGTLSTTATTSQLCAAGSSGCDFNNWDPNTEMLVFILHGSGNSAYFHNGSKFQGGIQATNNIYLENNVNIMGPLLGSTITISNNVVMKPLPQITELPIGAPGNPNTHASPGAPSYG
jgi:hypothetical protein